MPGDLSGGKSSVPSPGTPQWLPRYGALYSARARGPASSSSLRSAVGSARGAGRAPRGAEKRSLLFFPFPPRHTLGHPSNQSTLLPSPAFLVHSQLSVLPPPLSRYSSWLELGRAAPRVPSDLPACNCDHYRIQKHVDHTSVRLLRYRLLVQGTRGTKERESRQAGSPSSFQTLPSALSFWGTPLHLDFWGGEKSPSL